MGACIGGLLAFMCQVLASTIPESSTISQLHPGKAHSLLGKASTPFPVVREGSWNRSEAGAAFERVGIQDNALGKVHGHEREGLNLDLFHHFFSCLPTVIYSGQRATFSAGFHRQRPKRSAFCTVLWRILNSSTLIVRSLMSPPARSNLSANHTVFREYLM
jgi:hypothetical protein